MKNYFNLRLLFLLTITLWCAHDLSAATYTVDGTLGKDAAGYGSAAAPYKTLAYFWSKIKGGDTVYLKGGPRNTINNYTFPYSNPAVQYYCQGPTNLFTGWVYFVGDSSETVGFTNTLNIGANGTQYTNYNAYMSFTGVTFEDRIVSYGANYVIISNCKIQQSEPLRGPAPQGYFYNCLAGILVQGGNSWTLTNSEVTHCGFGLFWGASNSTITNNHIHDVSQDGLDFTGCTNVLFQGNTVYNCAEGDFSDEGPNPSTTAWARHCDGIQFIMRNDRADAENSFVTIRGNKIYGVERADIQDNNHTPSSNFHNHDILIENNIFGPTVATTPVMDFNTLDNLTVRQNTICMAATTAGIPYSNQFETIQGTNGTLLLGGGTNVQVYNNLLGDGTVCGCARYDHNIYQYPSGTVMDGSPLARGCVRTNPQLANPAKLDGILAPGSIAINAGTRLALLENQKVSDIPSTDYYGTERDNRPDCGAFEVANQNPAAETLVTLVTPINPQFWLANFLSGDLNVDPLLATANTSGIGWTNASTNGNYNFALQNGNNGAGNQLTEATNAGAATIWMNNVPSVTSFVLSFDVIATSGADGGGPCFLQTDAHNFYWLRLGVTTAAVHQIRAGVDTQILLLPGFALGKNASHSFVLSVLQGAQGNVLSVSRDNAVTQTVSIPSSGLPAANQFSSIGLYRNSAVQYQRLTYKNFRLQLGLPSPPTNLRVAGATN